MEDGPVQCIKCGGDSFIRGKSLSCLSGWAWPEPSACASFILCLHRVTVAALVLLQM